MNSEKNKFLRYTRLCKNLVKLEKQIEDFNKRVCLLETRAACAPQGSVRDIKVGPPGAVYAMEMIKKAERNAKDPNYVPSWNPGNIVRSKQIESNLDEVLKNPLLSAETRTWLQSKG
jgi:hypothetical protein